MANPRVGIFLQVRLDSMRVNRKALLPLINGNVIEHAMRSLKKVKADVYALLTDNSSKELLKEFADKEGFKVFPGPREDVLKRFFLAAEHFKVDCIVRATGDNPLVSAILAGDIISIHNNQSADLSHFIGMPLGTGVEVISLNALKKMEREAVDAHEREHITTNIYRNPDKYKVIEKRCKEEYYLPDIKISLDTNEDYELIKNIYNDVYDFEPIEIGALIRWIKRKMLAGKNTSMPGSKTGIRDRASDTVLIPKK